MQNRKKIIEIDLDLAQSILKKSGFEIVKIGKKWSWATEFCESPDFFETSCDAVRDAWSVAGQFWVRDIAHFESDAKDFRTAWTKMTFVEQARRIEAARVLFS
jgi:hypothetical protein